jgi:hypothetical protein
MKVSLPPELERLTERMIGAGFSVSRQLGHGFLEAVYRKAIEAVNAAHTGQVLNYLKASALPVGLLLNFGKPRMEVRRGLL